MSAVTRYDRDSLRRWGKYLAAALVFQGAIALLLRGGIRQQPFFKAEPLVMELVAGPLQPTTAASHPPAGGVPAAPRSVVALRPAAEPHSPARAAEPTPSESSLPQPKPGPAPASRPAPATSAGTAAASDGAASGGAPNAGAIGTRLPATATTGGSGPSMGGHSGGVGPVTQARPNYLHNPSPAYPSLARRRGLTGRVILKVRVGNDGLAREVGVRVSSGHAVLDESAASTVAIWRFIPARRGEAPVESWVDVPINFELKRQERG